MIPVVMESACRGMIKSGQIGMILGGLLYVDMCDGVNEGKVNELYDRIMSVIGEKKLIVVLHHLHRLQLNLYIILVSHIVLRLRRILLF